ncbi:glycosyltransferase family 2 protein [Adhaeribacter pallidiroseus]|uniref:Glycosyltransferase 2-like domain-containing protein n=1 Tax=Adhaeribacter pallidiroseus TaxID=2072847 RepID=A0A369QMQ0_9BACT|nr:glycosyltransferase [Adhaeribacter pallidiroseus]RDC64119.1 hypothetical protein AHMF7616_02729 [Adhaeribacter pallidiroseus]
MKDELKYPLVTIGTLCYNTGKYVVEALECVKNQNYPNIQHIIIDDFSKDNSLSLVEKWIEENNYKCTLIKHTANKGVHYNLQEILDLASGKYFAMISDDLWTNNKLLEQVSLFETLDNSYAIIYGDTNVVDKNGLILNASIFKELKGDGFVPPSGNIFKEVVKDFYFYIQSSIISLSHIRKMEKFVDKEIISEDWDWELWLSRNFNVLGLKDVYASYRILDTSITRVNWSQERMRNVLLSQIKMLLNYYNHYKNSEEDKELIFNRIWRMYKELLHLPKFTRSEKIKVLHKIFKVTKRLGMLKKVLNF